MNGCGKRHAFDKHQLIDHGSRGGTGQKTGNIFSINPSPRGFKRKETPEKNQTHQNPNGIKCIRMHHARGEVFDNRITNGKNDIGT